MKTVLITGASTGIGMALAKQLLARGYFLVLTARESSLHRFENLLTEPRRDVWIRPLDITSRPQRRALIDEIDRELGGVDILINNAGVAFRSVVEHVSLEEQLQQMDVNFSSPISLTRLVLPGMREKRDGRIINVSSVGGMMAMPTMAIYSASKFALEGATESLWYEVKPWNIKVSLVEPGFIHSESFGNTRHTIQSRSSVNNNNDPYHAHYFFMARFIEHWMRHAIATPDSIARRIVRLVESRRPPLRSQTTIDAHVFALLRRFLPQRLYLGILYRLLPGVRSWGATMDPELEKSPKGEDAKLITNQVTEAQRRADITQKLSSYHQRE